MASVKQSFSLHCSFECFLCYKSLEKGLKIRIFPTFFAFSQFKSQILGDDIYRYLSIKQFVNLPQKYFQLSDTGYTVGKRKKDLLGLPKAPG